MDLQERGWRAWALAGATQMMLPFGVEEGEGRDRKKGRR